MKTFALSLMLLMSSALAHAQSAVYTSDTAASLSLPASIEITSAQIELSPNSAELVLTGKEFGTQRFAAQVVQHNEERFDVVGDLVFPRFRDGRNCEEFESVKIRFVAPLRYSGHSVGTIVLNTTSFNVLGIREYTNNSCYGHVQTQIAPYFLSAK
jgi:hypothetical protein